MPDAQSNALAQLNTLTQLSLQLVQWYEAAKDFERSIANNPPDSILTALPTAPVITTGANAGQVNTGSPDSSSVQTDPILAAGNAYMSYASYQGVKGLISAISNMLDGTSNPGSVNNWIGFLAPILHVT